MMLAAPQNKWKWNKTAKALEKDWKKYCRNKREEEMESPKVDNLN